MFVFAEARPDEKLKGLSGRGRATNLFLLGRSNSIRQETYMMLVRSFYQQLQAHLKREKYPIAA